MSFNDIKNLRKTGKLHEALNMALEEFRNDPEDVWTRRALVWVYYDLLKQAQERDDKTEYFRRLTDIINLELPENEVYVHTSVAWSVGKFLFNSKQVDSGTLDHLFRLIKDMPFAKPDDSYSFLLKSFKKYAGEWMAFPEFLNWWGVENLQPSDFNNFITDDGKKIPSLAEGAYIAMAKSLLQPPVNEQSIRNFLPVIEKAVKERSKMQYPPYYYAKLLIALGDKVHFMDAFLPFARKKQRDFWVWDLMSEAFDKDSDAYFSCLCKALSCGAPDKFTGGVREKIAHYLIEKQQFPEAKYELERIISAREKEGWTLHDKHRRWKALPWWEQTKAVLNNNSLYKKNINYAESLLFANIRETLIVADNVNQEKTVFSFVTEHKEQGLIHFKNLKIRPRPGDVFAVRFKEKTDNKSNFYQVYSIILTDKRPGDDILRTVNGKLQIRPGNSFGFLNNVFVPSTVIRKDDLKDGDQIKTLSLISYNTKKKNWGWKAVKILD